MMNLFMWLMVALAVAGNVLIVKRRRIGFVCWIVADAAWIVHGILQGDWPEVGLFSILGALAVWGWFRWAEGGEVHREGREGREARTLYEGMAGMDDAGQVVFPRRKLEL